MSQSQSSSSKTLGTKLWRYDDELVQHLPEPGRVWSWTECDLPATLQNWLKWHGYINQIEQGRWETGEQLAEHVREHYGPLQCDLGQERIASAQPRSESRKRYLVEVDESDTAGSVQRTLDGRTGCIVSWEQDMIDLAHKGAEARHNDDGDGEVPEDQARLDDFTEPDRPEDDADLHPDQTRIEDWQPTPVRSSLSTQGFLPGSPDRTQQPQVKG